MSGCEQFRPQGLCCVDDIESMYLRDLFAGLALIGILVHPPSFLASREASGLFGGTVLQEAAIVSYSLADAMMKAREARDAKR